MTLIHQQQLLYTQFFHILHQLEESEQEMVIEKCLQDETIHICQSIVFILLRIYQKIMFQETTIYDYQSIIHDSLDILWNQYYLDKLIIDLNHAMELPFEEKHFIQHQQKYGQDITLDYDIITHIDKENIQQVYQQFSSFNHLNHFRLTHFIIQREYKLNQFDYFDSYLFCLFYFTT